jgi:hypothetical protein
MVISACSPKSEVRDTHAGAVTPSNWTEASLQGIIIPGKPKAEIDSILGPPVFEDTLPNGNTMAAYHLVYDDRAVAFLNRFSGVQIFYKDGRAVNWVTNYSTRTISHEKK